MSVAVCWEKLQPIYSFRIIGLPSTLVVADDSCKFCDSREIKENRSKAKDHFKSLYLCYAGSQMKQLWIDFRECY